MKFRKNDSAAILCRNKFSHLPSTTPEFLKRYHGISNRKRAEAVFARITKNRWFSAKESWILLRKLYEKYNAIVLNNIESIDFDYKIPPWGCWNGINYWKSFYLSEKTVDLCVELSEVAEDQIKRLRKVNDMKTTGDIRKQLAECFEKVKNGELTGEQIKGIIGCAKQITCSIAVELKARAQIEKSGGKIAQFGQMTIS